ncbi:MAG: hypothetical protein AAF666_01310 [Pseudomonadota bacterium]
MARDVLWSYLFAGAIAVLMFALLLIRSTPTPVWVFIVYPAVGALLAHVASRTSPTVDGISRIETTTIAAACIVVLAGLVNLLLVEILLREMLSGEFLQGTLFRQVIFFALPSISVLLWWALERRLNRLRNRARQSDEPDDSDTPPHGGPASGVGGKVNAGGQPSLGRPIDLNDGYPQSA